MVYGVGEEEMKQFISVHIPKTGGTIFLRQILKKTGRTIMTDYKSAQKKTPPPNHEKFDVIHGHFHHDKYKHLKRPYVVWLRDPADRIISHYSYAIRKINWGPGRGARNTTLKEFALKHRNTLTKYTGGDLSVFYFVGILEKFNECITEFARLMNMNSKEFLKLKPYPGPKVKTNQELLDYIKEINGDDYGLYQEGVEQWEKKGDKAWFTEWEKTN